MVDRSCGSSARLLVSRARTFSSMRRPTVMFGSTRPVRADYAVPGRKSSITGMACPTAQSTIDAAHGTDRLEGGARVDGTGAHQVDLGAEETDGEEEEIVLARERWLRGGAPTPASSADAARLASSAGSSLDEHATSNRRMPASRRFRGARREGIMVQP